MKTCTESCSGPSDHLCNDLEHQVLYIHSLYGPNKQEHTRVTPKGVFNLQNRIKSLYLSLYVLMYSTTQFFAYPNLYCSWSPSGFTGSAIVRHLWNKTGLSISKTQQWLCSRTNIWTHNLSVDSPEVLLNMLHCLYVPTLKIDSIRLRGKTTYTGPTWPQLLGSSVQGTFHFLISRLLLWHC